MKKHIFEKYYKLTMILEMLKCEYPSDLDTKDYIENIFVTRRSS